eukprot:m51a1_g3233 hypothetical protein (325) ;mRNA; r:109102-110211
MRAATESIPVPSAASSVAQSSLVETHVPATLPRARLGRRFSVSSESTEALLLFPRGRDLSVTPPMTGAHAETRTRLEEVLAGNTLTRGVSQHQLSTLALELTERRTTPGEVVIHQGGGGKEFYVIDQGAFVVSIDGSIVATLGPGRGFGELALMYDMPRAATVTSAEHGRLWVMEREVYRRAVMYTAMERRARLSGFLSRCPLLSRLSEYERASLADALESLRARRGEAIVREGEHGDRFFLVESGAVRVSVKGSDVGMLGPGDYFGELALLRSSRDSRRAATVTAASDVSLLSLSAADFASLLGPCEDVLRRNIAAYVPAPFS